MELGEMALGGSLLLSKVRIIVNEVPESLIGLFLLFPLSTVGEDVPEGNEHDGYYDEEVLATL